MIRKDPNSPYFANNVPQTNDNLHVVGSQSISMISNPVFIHLLNKQIVSSDLRHPSIALELSFSINLKEGLLYGNSTTLHV